VENTRERLTERLAVIGGEVDLLLGAEWEPGPLRQYQSLHRRSSSRKLKMTMLLYVIVRALRSGRCSTLARRCAMGFI
jgi:hypothetical protein